VDVALTVLTNDGPPPLWYISSSGTPRATNSDWSGRGADVIAMRPPPNGKLQTAGLATYVVGVINKIIHGVVQVEDFEMYPIREDKGETTPRVGFIGKLISDHPSIHCTLKEKTDSGPTQGFNFKEE